MAKKLYIVYKTAAGNDKNLIINAPRMNVTKAEAIEAFNKLAALNAIKDDAMQGATFVKAQYKENVVDDIE